MAAECLAALHLGRIRASRLDATGNPVAGPNNVVVSDKPITLNVTPVVEAGQDKTLTGGCDCVIATYRGYDKLKRFDFELDTGVLEPALIEMLVGGTIISSGADPIGVWWSDQSLQCGSTPQANVMFEAWQDAWETDHQHAVLPYIHWIWPSTYWQIGAHSLQNDFLQPKITGFSRGNTAIGDGIFGDLPALETIGPLGGFFYDDTIPTATCGYESHAIT